MKTDSLKITKTVNCSMRYYLDEALMTNTDSFMDTMKIFNLAKIDLYNQKYNSQYYGTVSCSEDSPYKFLKNKYNVNAYYQVSINSAADGQISSQKELRKFYKSSFKQDAVSRENKVKTVQTELDKKLNIKNSIVNYIKTGRWVKPYPRCRVKVCGSNIQAPGIKDKMSIDEYERKTEAHIRVLKNKLSHLEYGLKRKQQKIDNIDTLPPRRIIFGSRKLFSKKDEAGIDKAEWEDAFAFKRMRSMSLPGRHDAKYCNYLCRYIDNSLHLTNIDGTETIFKEFKLSRLNDEYLRFFNASRAERKPLCYNFSLKKDQHGRIYIIVSVTMVLENPYVNYSTDDGCVAIDLNYDHVALADIDAQGNLIDSRVIHFNIHNKSNGAVTDAIGRAMSEVGAYVEARCKPLIMENINTSKSKHGMRYGNSLRNKKASMFAYHKMTACLSNQAYKRGFDILQVNPAYTSQMGRFLYMKQYGLSVHQAAAYCIGLKGLGMTNKLKPDKRLLELLPQSLIDDINQDHAELCKVWRAICTPFSGVQNRFFYIGIPYDILKERQRPSIRTLSNEMRSWDGLF